MRFLGLGLGDRIPDVRTVWLYRGQLTQAGEIEALFETFDRYLKAQGYLAMGGTEGEGVEYLVHRKGRRNKPQSELEKQGNKTRSSVRVRAEHVFGAQRKDMGGTLVRSVKGGLEAEINSMKPWITPKIPAMAWLELVTACTNYYPTKNRQFLEVTELWINSIRHKELG